ncbi:hypothetical protein, variant [Fonticula alba]|nr:hypothetical protein, variant [Fonticula alba]KCV67907.1 hypothetical protein, variant [Fonticula alba]|eukprot:XP_009497727.1 hypothetical protein, variant [Fonticula alba]
MPMAPAAGPEPQMRGLDSDDGEGASTGSGTGHGEGDVDDPWDWWHQLRTLCDFHPRLNLALEVPADLPGEVSLLRWLAEPVKAFHLDADLFMANQRGFPVLSRLHQGFLKDVMVRTNYHFLVGGRLDARPDSEDTMRSVPGSLEAVSRHAQLYVSYLRHLARSIPDQPAGDALFGSYNEFLQAPLQPLKEHLDSQTYEVFENDPVKYQLYEEAIYQALLAFTRYMHQDGRRIGEGECVCGADAAMAAATATAVCQSGDPGACTCRGPAGHPSPRAIQYSGLAPGRAKALRDRVRNGQTHTEWGCLGEGACRCLEDWAAEGPEAEAEALETGLGSFAGGPIVVAVVGAGRGPLVNCTLQAAARSGRAVSVLALDKNPNAVLTLHDRARNEWGSAVTVFGGDMRDWRPPAPVDVLVSELLGSFGDNELSPECLDAAQAVLRPDGRGISVPACYTSHLAPVTSPRLHEQIRGFAAKEKPLDPKWLETHYVVRLRNTMLLARPRAVFHFRHPSPFLPGGHAAEGASGGDPGRGPGPDRLRRLHTNDRHTVLHFTSTCAASLTGFAGYFDCTLFGSVHMSTHPRTHSPDMESWFPCFFPLRTPVDVRPGDRISLQVWRRSSATAVWYEWALLAPVVGQIHNSGGRSCSMLLASS